MSKHKTAVVVPTINPDMFSEWFKAWEEQLVKHDVDLVKIQGNVEYQGSDQYVTVSHHEEGLWIKSWDGKLFTPKEIMGTDADLLPHKSSARKNFGLAFVCQKLPSAEYIVVLDDDTRPYQDTIGDHLKALNQRVPISWFANANPYMRGFPYEIRDEAPVMFSHGIWYGVPDLDAPAQLILGPSPEVDFYCGPLPKGVYSALCGMNIAFKRELLPFVYFAPGEDCHGCGRFDDIWMGVHLVDICAERNWGIVTGHAAVKHERQSNAINNLGDEWLGIRENERYWAVKDQPNYAEMFPFAKEYRDKRLRWKEWVNEQQ